MENTNLINVTSDVSFDKLASIIGQTELSEDSPSLHTLKINYDDEDDDGNSLPKGQWTITSSEGKVFAKQIDLQIFLQRYQYLQYDDTADELVNKSIYAQNLYPKTEVPDLNGTLRCGSVPYNKREQLSPEQALRQKSIRCFRVLFGKVTLIDAKNAKGESVTVKNLPCVWRARGSNFMAVSDAVDSLSAQKKPFIFYNLRGSLEKKKNGSVTYYVSFFKVNEGPLDFSAEDNELLKSYCDDIDKENKQVMKSYDASLRKKGKNNSVLDADFEEVVDVDDALNDDIPAMG